MPSSTSSSDMHDDVQKYDRPLPERSLGSAALIGLLVVIFLMSGWESYWRSQDVTPSYNNSAGQWAIQRRRIDRGEGDRLVLAGSSRVLFDTQLDVWEQESGERPIQLAHEGTSPVPVMESLAEDLDFTGSVIVGFAPDIFITGFQYRSDSFLRYEKESPTQWLGQRLSMLIEPYLAFYNYDFALFTILNRQSLPKREGVYRRMDVRHLFTTEWDRNTRLWSRLETDEAYAQIVKDTWMQDFVMTGEPDPKLMGIIDGARDEQIDRAVAAAKKLQERGVEVIFLRNPSSGDYRLAEDRYLPREDNWDVLIEKSGAVGIHFEDHEELQGYWLPEWSHLSGEGSDRYTKALYHVLQRERTKRQTVTE